jgi:hypothetical protein
MTTASEVAPDVFCIVTYIPESDLRSRARSSDVRGQLGVR